MALNPQVFNLVIILVMMQVSKKIPFDNPSVLLGVRSMYVVSNVLIMALYMYVRHQIIKKKDLRTLKYVEPPAMGSGEEPRPVITTVQDYDKQQLRSLLKGQLMGVGMMCVMHLYFKYTNPLVIQSIIPFKTALEGNLVKIHVFGMSDKGELERPWKAAGGLLGMAQGEVKKDRASVESAEKKWRGGAKEE
ncbi:inorganic phosphate transporter PHO88 [Histoplasma capsulatum G186AR]|uniref:Inorganic phosphate transporter PHO88 n=2 Tax=Ajellomyces capsulatus TaxID=5037 RepID=C0NRN2_AJECG|nr:inorganic phosphate transporter PHO88 [Histoplasma capsulatum G186AR]EEH05548.1 inorganic phosphate transporter PHO88 [Histoplasma capsulatum G186AR]KAG5298647.1 inorganic phosphate transporter PHO88 [Histoplasma ohiense (nom. inval.)]KAG5298717.1 inorganic phosphate transporter PHO88 [Histoplasma capsulatum]QSS67060.1 inorganic phosphate transporter PHO88 [Histoplasma capsulatum G186AR]